jgi:Fur family ferric uptake transcriptional regulator
MAQSNLANTLDVTDAGSAETALRRSRLRVSSARRLVLQALAAARQPVTAEEIATGLDGKLPRSDLASVYRNLETLENVGVVRHVHFGHGPGLYTLAGAQRAYVMCDDCRAIRVLEPSELEPVQTAVRELTGYEAHFGHFPLIGLCPRCRARRKGLR